MADAESSKKFKKFECIHCDYTTSRKSQWNRHIETKKHKRLTNTDNVKKQTYKCCCGKEYKHRQSLYKHELKCKFLEKSHDEIEMLKNAKNAKKMLKNVKCPKMSFSCICGKTYSHQASLSRHKSKCTYDENSLELVDKKESSELKEMFIDLLNKYTELAEKPTTINNNTQFNVMNYLNTECADAMNLTDFINDIQFSLNDLDLLQSKGYQEAMERTFVKQLCGMEKTKRPIHCSDKKRKSFYVKDNDVWEKDEDNKKLIGGFQKLSSTHNRTLSKWRSYNVDWSSDEKKQIFFNKSVQEYTKCDKEKEQKKIVLKLTKLSLR